MSPLTEDLLKSTSVDCKSLPQETNLVAWGWWFHQHTQMELQQPLCCWELRLGSRSHFRDSFWKKNVIEKPNRLIGQIHTLCILSPVPLAHPALDFTLRTKLPSARPRYARCFQAPARAHGRKAQPGRHSQPPWCQTQFWRFLGKALGGP